MALGLPKAQHTVLLIVALVAAPVADGMIAKMKLVDPAETVTNAPYAAEVNREHVDYNLKPHVPHSNFTGPAEMKRLVGECFTTNSENNQYEYRFCPFDNVTQHDIQASWNAYNGVLGIWHSWEVQDGKLGQQSFKEGDSCGSYNREVKVLFTCGKTHELAKPSEPNPCKYELEFATPHACNKSMHLSNLISAEYKAALKELDDELYDEEVTEAGYRKRQRKVLKRAGVLPSRHEVPRPTPPPSTPAPPTPPPYVWKSDATKLQECEDDKAVVQKVSDQLNQTVAHLTEQLEVLGKKLEELGHTSQDVLDQAAVARAAEVAAAAVAATSVAGGVDVEEKPEGDHAAAVDGGDVLAAASDADGKDVEETPEGGGNPAADTSVGGGDAAAAPGNKDVEETPEGGGNPAAATSVGGGDAAAAPGNKDVEETPEGGGNPAAAELKTRKVMAGASDAEGVGAKEQRQEDGDPAAAASVGGGDAGKNVEETRDRAAADAEGAVAKELQPAAAANFESANVAPAVASDADGKDGAQPVVVTKTKQVTAADVDAAAAAVVE